MRDPPGFNPRPEQYYYAQVGKEVTLVCGGEGTPKPTVTWRRVGYNYISYVIKLLYINNSIVLLGK